MTLTETHLTELRNYLKEFKAYPKDEADQGKADIVTSLIPAMVEAITDEELTDMSNAMWGYTITNMVTSAIAPGAEAPTEKEPDHVNQEPLIELASH